MRTIVVLLEAVLICNICALAHLCHWLVLGLRYMKKFLVHLSMLRMTAWHNRKRK